MSEVLTDADFQWARDRLERRIRGALLHCYAGLVLAEDLTVEQLARRIQRKPEWVRARLFGNVRLNLRDISDLALGMGAEMHFRVVPLMAEPQPDMADEVQP